MRVITFDIESISDSVVRGHIDVNEQELTVVGIHDSDTGEYSSYFKEDLHRLWPVLERADMLIGFNSDSPLAEDFPEKFNELIFTKYERTVMKAGFKTTEFWLSIATTAAALLGAVADVFPSKWAALIMAVSTGLYTISRGMAKKDQ